MRRRRAAVVLTGVAVVAVGVAMWEPSPLLPIADPDALPPFAVARIGKARFGGVRGFSPFEWTPDSREIVTLCGSRVRVFDATTGLVAREFDATIDDPNATAASVGERVMRWFRPAAASNGITLERAALARDGKRVAVGTRHGAAVFDLGTGVRVAERRIARLFYAAIAFTADERALLIAANDGLHRWDLRTGEDRILASASPVSAVVVSSGRVFTGLGNDVVEIDGDTLAVLRRTTIEPGPVEELASSPNGEWIAALPLRFALKETVLATSDLSPATIPGDRFDRPEWLRPWWLGTQTSPDGRFLADQRGSRLRVTSAHGNAPVPADGAIETDNFAVLADGRSVAVPLLPKGIGLFDLRTGSLRHQAPTTRGLRGSLVPDTAEARFLAPGSPPWVFDATGASRGAGHVPSAAAILRLRGDGAVWVSYEPSGVTLHDSTGPTPSSVRLRGEVERPGAGRSMPRPSALFDRGRRLAMFNAMLSPLRLWDCASGVATEPVWAPSQVHALAGAADADLLAVGDAGGWSIRETATGTELRRFPTSMHGADVAAFAPGALRVALSDGAEIVVADIASGSTLRLGRHAGDIELLEFTPDGSLLVSGSDDGTILVWDLAAAAAAAAPR